MLAARAAAKLAIITGMLTPAAAFDCVEKKCGEMHSCAEAYYHLEVCGEAKRDADGDGIPCENICGKTLEEYRQRRGPTLPQRFSLPPQPSPPVGEPPPSTGAAFACAGKRRCADMLSCEEARFYLTECGVTSLDRDTDGLPCESLCGGR